MSEIRPVLFNTDMVRAILDGRKTVARMAVMPHNRRKAKKLGYCQGNGLWIDAGIDNGDADGHIKDYSLSPLWINYKGYIKNYAPYRPGNILYVRETWNICNMDIEDNSMTFIYRADEPAEEKTARTVTVSDEVYEKYELSMAENNPEWRPSIHMPKEAARIWLKVTDVRVERLQDIDDGGIVSEGLEIGCDFENIWNATIKKPDMPRYGWDANPWAWVIEFKRCKKPEKWMEE